MAVSFEGRELTPEEEQRILDVITANSSIQIVCVMENGTALEEKMKARIEAREAEAANSYPYMEAENAGADFYILLQSCSKVRFHWFKTKDLLI